MANENAPLKPYNLAGYVISKAGGSWRAVDPSTGDIKFSSTSQSFVDAWVEKNPK